MRFFIERYLKYLWQLRLPELRIVDELPEPWNQLPEPVGMFDTSVRRWPIIYIIRKHDNMGVRLHEYGHWAIWRVYDWFDALWELPWWGFGLRKLFVRTSRRVVKP